MVSKLPLDISTPDHRPLLLAPSAGQAVGRVTRRRQFVELAPEWNALAERIGNPLFGRHEFFRIWLDHFASRDNLHMLTLRDGSGRLTAVLPLLARQGHWHGLPCRELCAATNLHGCRFDMLADEPAAAAAAFIDDLRQSGGWDLIRLMDVPAGGQAYALLREAAAAGLPTGRWGSIESPWLPLADGWDAVSQTIDTKFRANVRRRRKRLEEKGRITVERIDSPERLDLALEEGFELEASGWKGRAGTAMLQDQATHGFYGELARQAVHSGRLALWFLRLDGHPIAFQFGLEHEGCYYLLKPAYDEAHRECSPGHLLMDEVLRDCCRRGLSEFDFLGPDMPWKHDWTERVRPHEWLFIFRDNRWGTLLHQLKFKIGPRVRGMVQAWH